MSKHPSNALVTNRTARRDYHIIDSIETGIELRGTEVKSLRDRRANLTESFARIDDGELVLVNLHISPYDKGNRFNVDPLRPRKLLVHSRDAVKEVVRHKMRLFGSSGKVTSHGFVSPKTVHRTANLGGAEE